MDEPNRPSHFVPRTREGWIASVAFLALFALCMPPVTHSVLNRVEPTVMGLPFLYVALFAVYTGLIAVLLWALKKGV